MNAKKAKKLRQLVRHLSEKGGMTAETTYDQKYVRGTRMVTNEVGTQIAEDVVHVTHVLNKNCARAVYQQMKKA